MDANHTPLPQLRAEFHGIVGSCRMSFLHHADGRPDAISVGIGLASPVTDEMIAHRFNAYPALVEALKAIRSDDGDYGGAHLIRVAREALEKAGVK